MDDGIPDLYVVKTTSRSAAATETVRLFHGTDVGTADWIGAHGLNYERMVRCCPGAWAFWTSLDPRIAHLYGAMNPSQGEPAIISFDLPGPILLEWLAGEPPLAGGDVNDKAYCFLPQTFPTINKVMVNYSVQVVTTDLNISFGEQD